MEEAPLRGIHFDFEETTLIRVPLPNGVHSNVVVLMPTDVPNQYQNITDSVDIFYEENEGAWELVLRTDVPVTGNINIH